VTPGLTFAEDRAALVAFSNSIQALVAALAQELHKGRLRQPRALGVEILPATAQARDQVQLRPPLQWKHRVAGGAPPGCLPLPGGLRNAPGDGA